MQVLDLIVTVAEESGLSIGEQDRLEKAFSVDHDWIAAVSTLLLDGVSFSKLEKSVEAMTRHLLSNQEEESLQGSSPELKSALESGPPEIATAGFLMAAVHKALDFVLSSQAADQKAGPEGNLGFIIRSLGQIDSKLGVQARRVVWRELHSHVLEGGAHKTAVVLALNGIDAPGQASSR